MLDRYRRACSLVSEILFMVSSIVCAIANACLHLGVTPLSQCFAGAPHRFSRCPFLSWLRFGELMTARQEQSNLSRHGGSPKKGDGRKSLGSTNVARTETLSRSRAHLKGGPGDVVVYWLRAMSGVPANVCGVPFALTHTTFHVPLAWLVCVMGCMKMPAASATDTPTQNAADARHVTCSEIRLWHDL